MQTKRGKRWLIRTLCDLALLLMVLMVSLALPSAAALAQSLTGELVIAAYDSQGRALAGAVVEMQSEALIGGAVTRTVNDRGQLRFLSLPPGRYTLLVQMAGFKSLEQTIDIESGKTVRTTLQLPVAGIEESIVVEGANRRLDERDPGFSTRFGLDDLATTPVRRSSMFDSLRSVPGISPTSPSSGTVLTVSTFGSGINENLFLFDGLNSTCPCNGSARSEPGVDFIQEIHVQSVGASAEYGNLQGGVVNVVTRQGGERLRFDGSVYGQAEALTSSPVTLPYVGSGGEHSAYHRDRYYDATVNLGGPVFANRLWFFAGYQYLRDFDSQPGTDPEFPRTYEQDKFFGKLTWQLSRGMNLMQSFHNELGVNPDRPTLVTPFESIARPRSSAPAMTFGHLTHTLTSNTVWEARVGRFMFSRDDEASAAMTGIPNRVDRVTRIASGGPGQLANVRIARTSGKAMLTHYQPRWMGADHQWKFGIEVETGDHRTRTIVPTGARYEDIIGAPFDEVTNPAAYVGGGFVSTAAFATDTISLGDRLTLSAGLRFDRSRADSPDLPALDSQGDETDTIVRGLDSMYTWHLWSPRLGLTSRLTADGRTMLRASYGRYRPGILTGELQFFHPGATPTTRMRFNPATGAYDGLPRVDDPRQLQFNSATRAPRTDEISIGLDRAIAGQLGVAVAYVRKDGKDFIGWEWLNGTYEHEPRILEGYPVEVWVLKSPSQDLRYLLTNAADYSMTYDGVVMTMEKRRSGGWHALVSYTLSKAQGLQPSSGTTAAGAQVTTVSPPQFTTFGRDPNDLTNARGRLPNDRPHIFRLLASGDVPRVGIAVAASLQHFSGKPWAPSTDVQLNGALRRIMLEPRGARRLSSQTLLDVRVSKALRTSNGGRVELLLDILNLLNDPAEESLASEAAGPSFDVATVFMDPRRAMLGVRVALGR